MGKAKGEEQNRVEMVKKIEEQEAVKISQSWQKPAPASKNAPWYSYHFQCWNCLALHEGVVQSDNQLLEIECLEPMAFEFDTLGNLLGKPRICAKVNHCFGRKISKKRH